MQTVYYATRSYIRHQGNVVDLGEYRRRLSCAQAPEPERPAAEEPPRPRRTVRRRSPRRRRGLADWLDMTATVTVTALAATLWLQFML